MLFEVQEKKSAAVLKVIGLGGAGGNAVNRMLECEIRGVEFIVGNTDLQALNASACSRRIQLGAGITHGLGSGGDPRVGRKAAEEDVDVLRDAIGQADMVFLTAGMGGGTGTGACPLVAQLAREAGALTVAIVTKPFGFEGRRRQRQAEEGLEELRRSVDTLIVIPNQRLLHIVEKTTPLNEALRVADEVLANATKGISEIITVAGLINVDFADVRSVMRGMGNAIMGMGFGTGQDRAREAAQMAVSSPLLEDISIAGAQAVLVNFMGGPGMTLAEVDEAASEILEAAGDGTNVIFGAVIDPNLKDEMRVTLIATGFGSSQEDAGEQGLTFEVGTPTLREIPAASMLTHASVDAEEEEQEAESVGVVVGLSRFDPGLPDGAGEATPLLREASSDRRPETSDEARPVAGFSWGGEIARPLTEDPESRWDSDDLGDGVLGPARPMAAPRKPMTAIEPPEAPAPEASVPTAAVPDKVVPLVWRENLQGRCRAPRMSTRWQRATSRERSGVPAYVRRGRQID